MDIAVGKVKTGGTHGSLFQYRALVARFFWFMIEETVGVSCHN